MDKWNARTQALKMIAMAVALAGHACTFDPGQHFGTIEAQLQVGYFPAPDRVVDGDWQKTTNEYLLQVNGGTIAIGEISLLGSQGRGTTAFDAANPPPGYSLCHNGHCHHVDGRLVPYAEIEAELQSGEAGLSSVVAFAVPGPFDLTVPMAVPLSCSPSCGVPATHVVRASTPLQQVSISGSVRDGLVPPRFPGVRSFAITLSAADLVATGVALETAMDVPVDGDHDPGIRIDLVLNPGPLLFDGVDFAAVDGGGVGPAVLHSDADARAQVMSNLLQSAVFTARVTRN